MRIAGRTMVTAMLALLLALPGWGMPDWPLRGKSRFPQQELLGRRLRGGPTLRTEDLNLQGDDNHFKVNEAGINLYDDGGPTGKMSRGKHAQVTFYPNTEGKAVKVEFSLVELEGPSWDGKAGFIRIYEGVTADPANLLGELKNGETYAFMATSLTVETQSSNSYSTKAGFAATVKEIESTPKKAKSVESVEPGNAILSSAPAGDLMWIRIDVEGIQGEAKLSEVKLNLNTPTARTPRLELFYAGKSQELPEGALAVVSAISAAGENTLTLATPQVLSVGTNWLLLRTQVASCLPSDTEVSATLTSVTVADEVKSPATSAPMVRKISNTVVSYVGEQIYTVCDGVEARFASHLTGANPPLVEGEQKVTFKSNVSTEAVRIVLDKCEIGRPSRFSVYRGETANPSMLLWEKKDGTAQEETAPITLKGSLTEGNGALTVVYETLTTSQYGVGRGWDGKVDLFIPSDVKITSIASDHPSTPEKLYANEKAVQLLHTKITSAGEDNAPALEKLKLTLLGYDNLAAVRLFTTPTEKWKSETQVAETTSLSEETTLQLSSPITLQEGDLHLWVLADLKECHQVTHGATLDVTLSGYTFAGAAEIAVPEEQGASAGSYTVQDAFFMRAGIGHTTDVDGSLAFFDDGGPHEHITRDFDGTVTFTPRNASKRLEVTFTMLELFNTNPEKNDILEVYSGREAKPEALLKRLLVGPLTEPIRSAASDGAITVRLKSTTGVVKKGFEAVVSEIANEPMSLVEVKNFPIESAKAHEGEKKLSIQWINISTSGNQTPLKLESAEFTTLSSFEGIERAHLFFAGREQELSASATPLHSCDVAENTFKMTLAAPQELNEGNNWFAIAYDLKNCLANQTDIICKLTKAICSGAGTTAQGAEGRAKINNTLSSKEGDHTVTLCKEWLFTHTHVTDYNSEYAHGNKDQVTTFLSANPDEVVELKYSSFEVMATSYGTSTNATYKIYQGTEATGTPVWEVTYETAKVGPQKPIRGDLAKGNGAITVLFNPKQTLGQTAKGWTATATTFRSQPMEMKKVVVSQEANSALDCGTLNTPILHVLLQTAGDQDPLKLTGLTVDLKGSHVNLANVAIHKTVGVEFTASQEIAKFTTLGEGALTLTFDTPPILEEGDLHLWIVADVKEMQSCDMSVPLDAKILSYTLEGSLDPVVVADGDPEGAAQLTSVLLMQPGEVEVAVSVPINFYDDGGKSGEYSKNFKGSTTFIPQPGEVIEIEFLMVKRMYNDKLYAYHGKDRSGGSVELKSSETATIRSEALDGVLVIDFSSGDSQYDGWHAVVKSAPRLPMTLAANHFSAGTTRLLRGAQEVKALGIEVEITGDSDVRTLQDLTLSLAGTTRHADVSKMSLYYTGETSVYHAGAQLIGEATPAGDDVTITPTAEVKWTKRGKYHFWVLLDVAVDAIVNNRVVLSLSSASSNAGGMTLGTAPSVAMQVEAGIEGTFTVGDGGNFATWKLASEELKKGISGPVRMEFLPGSYDSVYVVDVAGTGSEHTLTVTSSTAKAEDVKFIRGRVSGTPYVTISNMTFESNLEGKRYLSLLAVENASNHITVKGNNFKILPGYNSQKPYVLTIGSGGGTRNPEQKVDYVLIEGNTFDSDLTPIEATGKYNAVTPIPPAHGLVIRGNTINAKSQNQTMWLQNYKEVLIENNIITQESTKVFGAIRVQNRIEGSDIVIRNNRIWVNASGDAGGVYLDKIGLNTQRIHLYNNAIDLKSESGFAYGVNVEAGSYANELQNLLIAHNTIRIYESAKGAGMRFAGTTNVAADTRVANNIIQTSALPAYWIGKAEQADKFAFSHNTLHTDGGKIANLEGNEEDFATWGERSNVKNAEEKEVTFKADAFLRPDGAQGLQSGTPLAEVATDLFGVTRSTESPTRGAYEWQEPKLPKMISDYPALSSATHNELRVKLRSDEDCEAYLLIQKSDEPAPSAESVLLSIRQEELALLVEKEVIFTDLQPLTSYTLYVVLKNAEGASELYTSASFKTAMKPTEVSTFETLAVGTTDFIDGTQSFSGFEVVAITDNPTPSVINEQAAKLNGVAGVVTMTNNPVEGVEISGFFLKSNAAVSYVAKNAEGDLPEVQLASAEGEWRYISLKQHGKLLSLELSKGEATEVLLDNFAGQPNSLALTISGETTWNKGEEIALNVEVNGGVQPYTYEWRNASGQLLASTADLITAAVRTQNYTVTVIDAWGNIEKKGVEVIVQGGAEVATFEDLGLAKNSAWKGNNGGQISFTSGTYAFVNHSSISDGWSGFGYSSEESTEHGGWQTDTRSAVGHGVDGSDTWGVLFYSSYSFPGGVPFRVTNSAEGDIIPGVYVTNTAWVVDATQHGPGFGDDESYKQGDYMRVTFTGDNHKFVEYYLADFRNTDNSEHYVLTDWAWVDLAPLGKVKEVKVQVEGSRSNAFGPTMPAYVCLDNLGAEHPERIVAKQFISDAANAQIDLPRLTSFELDKPMHFEAVGDWSWPGVATAVGINSGRLIVEGWDGTVVAEKEFTVKATQHGRSEWLIVPVALVDKTQTSFVFEKLIVDGEGVVRVLHGTVELSQDDEIQQGDWVTVEAVPQDGWELLPENLRVNDAQLASDGRFQPEANFSISVKFTKKPTPPQPPTPQPTMFTLTRIETTGKGTVTVTGEGGEVRNQGDKVKEAELLTITATPTDPTEYELSSEGIKVVGATSESDGRWKVTGDVVIKAAFVKKSTPPDPHVGMESAMLTDAVAYPNPFGSSLSVRCGGEVAKCTLLNVVGNVLLQTHYPGAEFTLDLAHLPAGIYILQLDDGMGGETTLRVVKQ